MEIANTFDLYVLDVSCKWDKKRQESNENGAAAKPNFTQTELLAILNQNKKE